MSKFKKYRSVDKNWLHVPTVYILNETGSNIGKKKPRRKHEYDYEYGGMLYRTIINPGEPDKTLAIIQMYGLKKALCAWRNEETGKMGLARIYPMKIKNNELFLIYKGREISITKLKSGWVL